ncbi:hypothetical protein E2C01_018552 [Portunus trituberculatus]|uniref:Uncharacterized protein n=1 Tax=Portunus trituberculatus TaxID=210409 RepID=A0A5B7DVG0_PORTR|nr:hypothetical protein [Portunus trituberculatus]
MPVFPNVHISPKKFRLMGQIFSTAKRVASSVVALSYLAVVREAVAMALTLKALLRQTLWSILTGDQLGNTATRCILRSERCPVVVSA